MEDPAARLLLVEDTPDVARMFRSAVERWWPKSTILQADSLQAALKQMGEGNVDLVILDLNLPDAKDLEALEAIRARFPGVPVVVATGMEDDTLALRALRSGAQDFLGKGHLDVRTLLRSVRFAIERARARA